MGSCDHEDPLEPVDMRGTSFCFVAASHFDGTPVRESCASETPENFGESFVGLTTAPCLGVVGTAAQDGLIGSKALERLKEQLSNCGLQVKWTGKQAKAHGVGGQAKVLGIIAIPLGIAGSSGILEATVVEGEIPLLLPIKMLRQLRAVIDLEQSCLKFSGMEKSVPLIALPSGHVAIEIFQFGESGFRCPVEAEHAGYSCDDFRNTFGPKNTVQRTMVAPLCASNFAALGHGALGISATKIPEPCIRRCEHGRQVAKGRVQFEEGSEALASDHRQVDRGGRFPLARGIGQLMVAGGHGEALCGLFSRFLRAARRHHQVCRESSTVEEQDKAQFGARVVPSPEGEVGGRSKPTCSMGVMHRLPLTMEGTTDSQELGQIKEQDHEVREEPSHNSSDVSGGGRVEEGVADEGAIVEAEVRGAAKLSDPWKDDVGEHGAEVEGAESFLGGVGADEVRVWRAVAGKGEIPGGEGIPRRRDVCLRREVVGATGGGASIGRGPSTARTVGEVTGDREASQQSKSDTWVQLSGPGKLKTKVEKLRRSGHYEVVEVYAVDGNQGYVLESDEMLDFEDSCVLRVRPTEKGAFENEVPEVPESTLPKKTKKKLRAAHKHLADSGVFPVAISEVFSPPRISESAAQKRLKVGRCYNLQTGFDLLNHSQKRQIWDELEEDDPELVTCSPPCTPFSPIQGLNWDRMPFSQSVHMVAEGVENFETAVEVCVWQDEREKLFLLEHPLPSKAWEEECAQRLMQRPGVYVCNTDLCQYGMKVRELPNKKATRWITNSKHVAMELQRRCNGEHVHEHLMGGLAKFAAIYPKELCQAIVRGLLRHLRATNRLKAVQLPEERQAVFLGEDEMEEQDVGDEAEEEEDIEEQIDQEVEKSGGGQQQPEVQTSIAFSKEDQAMINKLHINLGHPALASFLRFLRAGRVRPEILH